MHGRRSYSYLSAKILHHRSDPKHDGGEQNRDHNRRPSGRARGQEPRRNDKKNSRKAGHCCPLLGDSRKALTYGFFRERSWLRPILACHARHAIGDIREHPKMTVRWLTEGKLGNLPEHAITACDGNLVPGNEKVAAERSKNSHDSDAQSRRTHTELQNAAHGDQPQRPRLIRQRDGRYVVAVRVSLHQAEPTGQIAQDRGHCEPEERKADEKIERTGWSVHDASSGRMVECN